MRDKATAIEPKLYRRNMGGATLNEFLAVFTAFILVVAGLYTGFQIGYQAGLGWAVLGSLIGLLLGVLLTVTMILACAYTFYSWDMIRQWWRPYPPVCENGICRGHVSYTMCNTPEGIRKQYKGFSPIAYQCKCGHLYAGRCANGRWHWVRIYPDNTFQAYLKRNRWGRWQAADHAEAHELNHNGFKVKDLSVSKEDLEKYLRQSGKAVKGHIVFILITLVIAIAVRLIWNPRWWIYLLFMWSGPFGLSGDLINIWYCRSQLRRMSD